MPRILLLIALIASLFLSGCAATTSWRDPLGEDETNNLKAMLLQDQKRVEACPGFINADIAATMQAPFHSGGITGYLQLLFPSSAKLVAINPLSQPLFAVTLSENTFQAIDVPKGIYKHGRTEHFAERHGLPVAVLEGNWAEWLSSRAIFNEKQLLELRQDATGRGIWIVVKKSKLNEAREYLLYEPRTKRIIERIPVNYKGKELATIAYSDWTTDGRCPLPATITIQDTAYNASLTIKLSEISSQETCKDEDFYLKKPPNFLRQYYP